MKSFMSLEITSVLCKLCSTSKLLRDFIKTGNYTLDAESPAKPGGLGHSEPVSSFRN